MYAAYILIDLSTDVDFPETLNAIRDIAGVKQAHLAVGPNDCIAYIEVDDQRKAIVTLQTIRNVEGVVKTDTRPVAEI